jgi:hypothetical protein
MFSRNRNARENQSNAASRSWEKIGQKLYRIHGDRACEWVEEEAKNRREFCKAEGAMTEERLSQLKGDLGEVHPELERELVAQGVTVEKARIKHKGAWLGVGLAALMVIVGTGIIAWSLAPSFYGYEVPWIIVSAGLGLVVVIGMKVFLHFMERVLNPKQFAFFNALIASVMVAFFVAGFVQMSQARVLQMEISQQLESDEMIYDEEMLNIDEAKGKLDDLLRRAMVFLFIGFEWLTGVFFYLTAGALARYGPVVKLAKRRDSMLSEQNVVSQRKVFNERVEAESIKNHLRNGIEHERNKGSVPLLITVVVLILGVLIASILLSEKAIGGVRNSSDGECTYFLVSFDVTGSTEHDQQENQRAIIKIITSLQPCDEFQLVNITQATFSDPEYMIHHKMPSKEGYFKEEIRKHRVRLVSEFRAMCERIPKERPATSIIEGLYMFSHLLIERPDMSKKLILISDMKQFAKDIGPAKIAAQGDKILSGLKVDGLIPDMTGIEVYVMGASTAGLDAKTWSGLKKFWASYFKTAGATLKCYSIQRHWPID